MGGGFSWIVQTILPRIVSDHNLIRSSLAQFNRVLLLFVWNREVFVDIWVTKGDIIRGTGDLDRS